MERSRYKGNRIEGKKYIGGGGRGKVLSKDKGVEGRKSGPEGGREDVLYKSEGLQGRKVIWREG